MDDPFQTQTSLRQTLSEAGLLPKKRFGQHFLVDRNLMMKLVDATELTRHDCVLEVGAGTGSLSGLLASSAGAVVAVEIDEFLAGIAGARMRTLTNVSILNIDVLEKKSSLSHEVLAAVSRALARTRGQAKLVANLPYDIATPLVVNLLIGEPQFERFCFTVQKEVADRFLARPGTSDFGPVSIISQVMAEGRLIAKVPPEAFWPRPKVDSAMIVLKTRPSDEISIDKPRDFITFVRVFFQHRRQMIGRVAKTFEYADRLFSAMDRLSLDRKIRPADVTVQQWVELYRSSA